MVRVNPNEPFPGETPRSALSNRLYAHINAGSNRARELEMVASHASVEGLNLPPDMIALAYEENNGELVNTLMDLTEPVVRERLERELAERQAAEQEEEESNQRELDLWLLVSQVPGCTREHVERSYRQAHEDVSRALPLVRMATMLADREAMVGFIMEMHPGGLRVHAEECYDQTEGDIVDAVVEYHCKTARFRDQEPMRERCLHRLRIRVVFALALVYRERYGQMEPEASAALAQAPLAPRPRTTVNLPSFRTPDGVQWTYSAAQGWERRLNMEPVHLGRAAQATEQLARLADARGEAQTAARARQTAAGMRDAQTTIGTPRTSDYRRMTPQQAIDARLLRESMQATITTQGDDDGWITYGGTLDLTTRVRNGNGAVDARRLADIMSERERASETSNVDSYDEDDDGDDVALPELLEASSSSTDEDDENEDPTAGAYAHPRAFTRLGATRRESVTDIVSAIKRNLRAVQEQLDAEIANASTGEVMSEGAYVSMMGAIKNAWECSERLSR